MCNLTPPPRSTGNACVFMNQAMCEDAQGHDFRKMNIQVGEPSCNVLSLDIEVATRKKRGEVRKGEQRKEAQEKC